MSTMGYILPKLYEECSHYHQGRVVTDAKGNEPTIAGPYKIWDKSKTCPGGINIKST